ncbi:exported hypothetical protein [Nitrosopumilaceae archaeon]|nr:tetratricopeptide repeat protein [Nitrosopumilus sp.]CAI9831464.1 exported hypothetical protein [Nitrosopumilaceae archaeon]MDA7945473.1 tetratricopeptide repeat protein [Nitrosopumilus sp.]MDA7955231.1 tetratricopeptide repeat protein [Nitrosopumilus sp.]MDA7959927.1 tetratricopeptide repeat protein [Nitrosopumilus sp.]
MTRGTAAAVAIILAALGALAALDISALPGDKDWLLKRGNVLWDGGQGEAALPWIDRALEIDPGFARAHSDKGLVLYDLGLHEEAIASLDRAIQIEPDNAAVIANKGWVLWGMGRNAEALSHYEEAAELDSSETFTVNRAAILSDLGRYEEALALYDQIRAMNPDLPYMHLYDRAAVLVQLGRHGEALVDLESLIEAHPWDSRALLLMEEIGGR